VFRNQLLISGFQAHRSAQGAWQAACKQQQVRRRGT